VVPTLTAAAERLAPPAMMADRGTPGTGHPRRAGRPAPWNPGR
jgi:hypothetical protein